MVLSTLCDTGSDLLQQHKFDILIVDEATQAVETECWVAIARCNKVILAGDPHQLSPTILSQNTGLERTMFERLINTHGDSIYTILTTQYRMNEKIMALSSNLVYKNQIKADKTVYFHTINSFIRPKLNGIQFDPLTYIDTSGLGYNE